MTLRLQRRLLGVLLAAGLIYLGAMNSLLVWLYAATAMLLALLPAGLAGPWFAVRRAAGLDVEGMESSGFDAPLATDASRVFAGDLLCIRLRGAVDLDRVALGPLVTSMGALAVERAEPLPGGCALWVALGGRGNVEFDAVEVTSTWPFGILEVRRRLALRGAVLVHPRYSVVPAQRGTGAGIGGEDPSRKGHGEDVIGLREFRWGDSRRQIHWMTTARTGVLTVVERAAPTFAALQARLRLDPGGDPDAVELAVFVAATLAASCAQAGRPFRLGLPDGPPEARRWNDAIARLARVRPAAQAPGGAMNAVIRTEGTAVVVESEAGSVRLLPGAPQEAVEAAVAGLL